MQDYFYTLADRLQDLTQPGEILLSSLRGEDSDFVRFNHNRVRQAGSVMQRALSLDLIEGERHAGGRASLSGDLAIDSAELGQLIENLRAQRPHLGDDPHLRYATEVHDTVEVHDNTLPDSRTAVERIVRNAGNLDLVGLWASGTMYAGFANTLGQRNWYSSANFNFDWSCYHEGDKAAKCSYAGLEWDPARLDQTLSEAREQLARLSLPAKSIPPGRYRVYLAPAALQEILTMLAWGGFGLKSHRTRQTPWLKMIQDGRRLAPAVTLEEDHTNGVAPRFTSRGFIKPDRVTLIEAGEYRDCLVSAPSGREYGVHVNAEDEYPESLCLAAGDLPRHDVLQRLETGLYINNLWYCNFSERDDARITGMTRFACFWVEDGAIQAPINVMRFDESAYRMLGDNLIGLTDERDFILDPGTYEQRSISCMTLPGALIEDFTLTL